VRSIRVIAESMRLVMVNLGVKVDIIRLCFVSSCLRVRFPVSGYVQGLIIPQRGRMWKPEGAPGMVSHEGTKPRRGGR
jgi:hypothetical protein